MTFMHLLARRVAGIATKIRHYLAHAGPILALLAILPLAGCASVVVGAGASAGVAAFQERGFENAVSDTAITAEIWEKYLSKDDKLFRRIEIEVIEGEVLLAGYVDSRDEELEAIQLAWQAKGVKRVINELQLGEGGSLIDNASDLLISARIKTSLMFDGNIFAINYSIETVDGTVHLMGIAQNAHERDLVIAHARATSYVRRVISHIRLKDDPERQRT